MKIPIDSRRHLSISCDNMDGVTRTVPANKQAIQEMHHASQRHTHDHRPDSSRFITYVVDRGQSFPCLADMR
jgi:hypothetical protein